MNEIDGILSHIEIYASDLKKSINFWKDILEYFNYKKFQEWAGGISWKKGDTYLVFVQTKDKYKDIPYNRCRTGLNHIAFHVSSTEKINQIAEILKTKGSTILYNDKFRITSDPYSIFTEDPDRIKVEFVLTSN